MFEIKNLNLENCLFVFLSLMTLNAEPFEVKLKICKCKS